ncbi:Acyltransferase family protein [Streptomyces sp. ScaeMP-e48]|uniref:acyltransferase family protein n=1 Tax=Streptomyces sp. ScaeMP-e48 TaxID=1100823 RepID=UPI000823D659|nr:acyltransferase [Streptomyces sp. ScaeMP-e48]SCK08266.1 Acyltransferase family protein [Streptomyces sp. ScaeMP-e48]
MPDVRESSRRVVARIEAATPPGRDRAVDALRALAILGVVGGHWLVTALVADSGTVRGASPLVYLPHLTPVSWVFQTLAVFFLVGGMVAAGSWASARKRGVPYGQWVGGRLARLFRPVAAVLVVWTLAAGAMLVSGVGEPTVFALAKLVWSPLWFLLVFAALTALTPLVARLHPLWPLAVVLHVDLVRFGLGGPSELGWINVVAGWLVPYCLGALVARGGLRGRRNSWALLLGGVAAAVSLVLWAGYPASMVGVPGGRISNLDPPSLAAVSFGLAQCGAALLLLGPLRRALRRPAAWAAVALVNLAAMTVFLWHQTAMIVVTASALLVAGEPLPGLHTVPDGVGWVVARLLWLPVFALALLVCWAAFRNHEQGGRKGSSRSLLVRESSPGPSPERKQVVRRA